MLLLMSWCLRTCHSSHYLYLLSELCSGQAFCWAMLGAKGTQSQGLSSRTSQAGWGPWAHRQGGPNQPGQQTSGKEQKRLAESTMGVNKGLRPERAAGV